MSSLATQRPMFPHALDSTMMAAFRSCPQKMLRTYVQHWKPQAESVHLVAGGAFAKGIETARKAFYEESAPQEDAVAKGLHACLLAYGDFECPPDSAKSLERTVGALEFYFEQYPLGADGMEPIRMASGRRGIEFSFATPLGIMHPVSGDPILYTGRADMIAEYAGGVYVVDEKTTSSLGASWSRQWEMRGQFTGYQWAAREHGIETQGSIVRGVSILKTKYDTQQALTYRTPWEIERWYQQTLRDVERMIQCWRDGWWDYALDGACGEYGGCSMIRICKSQDPESWLPMYFEQRVWDPLAREEKTVQEWEASWGHTPDSDFAPLAPLTEPVHHVQKASGAEGVIVDI